MPDADLTQPDPGALRPARMKLFVPAKPIDGECELAWLDAALEGEASATLWVGHPGLVAPLSYRRHAALEVACAAAAARGWPVRLRRSGGGVVPQGPGILNLSLAYPCASLPGDASEAVYVDLCGLLAGALATLGIEATARAVVGSFCDGRFNLAVGHSPPRKIVGTAQYWRRRGGRQAVLAHALIVVDADPGALTAVANQFEAELGSGHRYDPDALSSVAEASGAAPFPGEPPAGRALPTPFPSHFSARSRQLIDAIARTLTHGEIS